MSGTVMKKLTFEAHTLDEPIVQHGLCAVGTLEDRAESRDMSFVVGGVATQSYLPSSCRRPTVDIDLAVLRSFSLGDFKRFVSPVTDYLGDNSYDWDIKKAHNSYQIIYSRDEDAAVIEFARRSSHNIQENLDRLNTELARSRNKIVEGHDGTYRVASPEDIVTPKLVRTVNSLGRNFDFMKDVTDSYFPLTSDGVKKKLREINGLRQEATIGLGDVSIAERLRIVSDMYDIRVLSALAGYNESSLLESMNNWNTLRTHPEECALVFNHLLPRFSQDFLEHFKARNS